MIGAENIEVNIAILSDLHCCLPEPDNNFKESFLIVGAARLPSQRHPVQALIELIKKYDLNAKSAESSR